MKKLLLTTAFLTIGIAGALAQGTVNFNNSASLFTDGVDRYVYSDVIGGSKLVGTNYVAELWWGLGGGLGEAALNDSAKGTGSTVVTPNGGGRFRTPTTSVPGTWTGGNRTMNGADVGATVTLQVRVFDLNAFQTFAEAVSRGGIYGKSDPFNYTVPAPGSPAGDYTMKGLTAFALVPEPSSIALGVLGLGALVLFRRRKN